MISDPFHTTFSSTLPLFSEKTKNDKIKRYIYGLKRPIMVMYMSRTPSRELIEGNYINGEIRNDDSTELIVTSIFKNINFMGEKFYSF